MNNKAKFDEEMRVLDEAIADAENTLKQLQIIRAKKLQDAAINMTDLFVSDPEKYFSSIGDRIFKNKTIIIDPECQHKGIKP